MQLANVLAVAVEPHAIAIEREPNELAAPQAVELPVTITGRLDVARDVDVYAFTGVQGQALSFELASRSLGFPIDGVLEVFDEAGKSLAGSTTWAAPAIPCWRLHHRRRVPIGWP